MNSFKNILISGGAGFIGSNLAETLLKRGVKVCVVDNLSTGRIENIEKFITNSDFLFINHNLRTSLPEIDFKPDIVIHMASAVGVELVVNNPDFTLENNILSTINTIALARRFQCPLILTSSSEIYGNKPAIPSNEEEAYLPGSCKFSRWSYSVSKIADEFLAHSYFNEGFPVTVVRLFNVIGGNQCSKFGMVVPKFIKAALNDKPLTVYGEGKQTRSFCYIQDITDAFLKLLDIENNGFEIINIGSNFEISVIELAELVIRLTNSKSKIEFIPFNKMTQGFEEPCRRVPDITKARLILDWFPTTTVENSLKHIIEFYRSQEFD